MVGPTAQIVALTCHLNARKQGITTLQFFPENSTCQFCEFIRFLRAKRKGFTRAPRWEVVAGSPDDWFDLVVDASFYRARLIHGAIHDPRFSDRMTAGFVGGGGRWLLAIERGEHFECWEASWEVGNKDASDRRIWKVQYALVDEVQSLKQESTSVNEIVVQLTEALRDAEGFARQHDLGGFADFFNKAQRCLSADDPLALVYHRDLAPEGALSLTGVRLLACCQAAWVFGGMGSWNDLGFGGKDQELYSKLSDRLFELINQAICAGANDTAGTVG
jgi:hypothetical protein